MKLASASGARTRQPAAPCRAAGSAPRARRASPWPVRRRRRRGRASLTSCLKAGGILSVQRTSSASMPPPPAHVLGRRRGRAAAKPPRERPVLPIVLILPRLAFLAGHQSRSLGPGRRGGGCADPATPGQAAAGGGARRGRPGRPGAGGGDAAQPRARPRAVRAEHVGLPRGLRDAPRRSRAAPPTRVRIDYPISVDRVLGLGVPPTVRLQRDFSDPDHINRFERVLVWCHWVWFMVPHGSVDLRDAGADPSASVGGGADVRGVRHGRRLLLGDSDRSAVVRGPPRATQEAAAAAVRRMMIEYGEQFWGDRWTDLYDVLGGNPLAAMPSLHFATSLMGAHLLAEVGPVVGRRRLDLRVDCWGWRWSTSASTTRRTCVAGAALAETVRTQSRRAAPAGAARPGRWRRCNGERRPARPRVRGGAPIEHGRASAPGTDGSPEPGGDVAGLMQTSLRRRDAPPTVGQHRGDAACPADPRAAAGVGHVRRLHRRVPVLRAAQAARPARHLEPVQHGNAGGWRSAAVLEVCSFLCYIVAVPRRVRAGESRIDWRASYEITMAGLAATRLFASAGAGGVALTAWALRRSGMEPRVVACRMVAFMALLYAVFMGCLVIVGLGLYFGVFPGRTRSPSRSCRRSSAPG